MKEEIEFNVHKNINFKPKVFGIFEKKSFILIMLITFTLVKFLDLMKVKPFLKLEILIIFLIPTLLFSAYSNTYENPVYILKYLIIYAFSKKVYLYKRESDENKNFIQQNEKDMVY